MECEHTIQAEASKVYAAWSEQFDLWFAQAGTVNMVPEAGRPYFFYNRNEWGRHPHYGRFLDVKENELLEMTWMTGDGTSVGTAGAETILRVELTPEGSSTKIHLKHSGFVSEESRAGHAENWPLALDELAKALEA